MGLALTGCGNAIDCAVNGDNLRGRVTYGQNVAIHGEANVVVQYSTSSFATDTVSDPQSNLQGLLTVPYGFCVPSGTYQLRAFQDLNKNGELDVGEPWGRLDGTDSGDAAYLGRTVTASTDETAGRVTDANITIDNP